MVTVEFAHPRVERELRTVLATFLSKAVAISWEDTCAGTHQWGKTNLERGLNKGDWSGFMEEAVDEVRAYQVARGVLVGFHDGFAVLVKSTEVSVGEAEVEIVPLTMIRKVTRI